VGRTAASSRSTKGCDTAAFAPLTRAPRLTATRDTAGTAVSSVTCARIAVEMQDPGPLLSTLAQAAAVFVAIVGGFLVSRLVAIASDRDGLKRRYTEARYQLGYARAAYDTAHGYRLARSQNDFRRWVPRELAFSEATPAPAARVESTDHAGLAPSSFPQSSERALSTRRRSLGSFRRGQGVPHGIHNRSAAVERVPRY
jgi:uncharacterized protein YgiB involved in biofilm formation